MWRVLILRWITVRRLVACVMLAGLAGLMLEGRTVAARHNHAVDCTQGETGPGEHHHHGGEDFEHSRDTPRKAHCITLSAAALPSGTASPSIPFATAVGISYGLTNQNGVGIRPVHPKRPPRTIGIA